MSNSGGSLGQSVSQMVNVIMSQDSSDQLRQSMLNNGNNGSSSASMFSNELAAVLSSQQQSLSPGMQTPTHDMQTPVTFKREIMETEVSNFQ